MEIKENEGVGNCSESQECKWDMHGVLTIPHWLSLSLYREVKVGCTRVKKAWIDMQRGLDFSLWAVEDYDMD